ncbi:MAG: Mov34/MPN/PAD-1 family protein [Salinivirgaceae bacterium]
MEYNYPIIKGETITKENLVLTRAKKLARVLSNYSGCVDGSLRFVRKDNYDEVILAKFDIEVPQYPKNGIKAYEEVAIICSVKDDNFPEVYALRSDFKTGLPHTNAKTFEYPINLCVTEELFREVKYRFNEFEFVSKISRWFKLTAIDELHQEDQQLEPFYIPKGYVLIPENFNPFEYNSISRIGSSIYYNLVKEQSIDNSFTLQTLKSDPKKHGYIQKIPQKLSDVDSIITIKGRNFTSLIKEYFDNYLKEISANKLLLNTKLAFNCLIPVKRNNEDKEETYEYLFLITNSTLLQLGQDSGCLEKMDNEIVQIFGKKFDIDIIKNIELDLYSSVFDFNRTLASFYNNIDQVNDIFTLIGSGALGSQFLDNISRLGLGYWNVIDHDILAPHNLAKHCLGREDIGYNKASQLSKKLNQLLNCEFATPIESNFLDIYKDESFVEKLKNSKAIIDMSTSITVARALANDFGENIKAQRISSFLNPKGNDLVILAEDKRRRHRLDFLEMQYYRNLFHESKLHNHLQFNQSQKIRYNRNSCREITNRINQTDVSLLSSIVAKTIKSLTDSGQAAIKIWSIDNDIFEVCSYSFEPTRWIRKNVGDWKIYVDHWLVDKMKDFRKSKLPNETGGVLIGSYDTERKIIYVCDTLFAPTDSIEKSTSFERGKDGLLKEYKKYLKVADGQLFYIGEWHSHPDYCSVNPSNDDKELYKYLYYTMSKQGFPVVMGILGNTDCEIVFKDPDYEI